MKYKKKEKMYQKLLKEVANKRKTRGKEMQPPCSSESLNRLREEVRIKLHTGIPDEYATFLSRVNGIDWNGLMLYASEKTPIVGYKDRFIWGFVEANLLHRDRKRLRDFLVFGHSGLDMYVYHIPTSEYQIVDQVSLSLTESVPSFDHLIAEALKAHL